VYPNVHSQSHIEGLPVVDTVNRGHAEHAARAVVSLYVCTAQSPQLVLPFVALYLPSAHATHGPPSAPSYPVLHVQFVTSVAARSGS
jgi:hypothetical protein